MLCDERVAHVTAAVCRIFGRTTAQVVSLSQAVPKQGPAAAIAAAPAAAPADSRDQLSLVPAAHFAGARAGFAFQLGPQGLGYYRDDATMMARPSRTASAPAAAPAASIAAAGAAKQPTDAATQALLQTVSAIGQSAAAAMRLTMSVAGQSPAAKSAIRPATAALLPAPRPAAVYEQPSSRATAFDHSSRTAAGSPLRGQSAAGATSSAALTAPIPPPVQQPAVSSGGGAATAAVSAAPGIGLRQQALGVIGAQHEAASAAQVLSRSSSGGGSRALAASEPAKPGKQTQPSVTAAVPGRSSAVRSPAIPAGPAQNGDGLPPGLAHAGTKSTSSPSAVQPSASHTWSRSGAVAAQAAERTAAAAPSRIVAACGTTATPQSRADQPAGLGTGHWSLTVAADPRPPVFTNPAHIDASESRTLEPGKASDSTSLAVAHADTTARAGEDRAGSMHATAAASPAAKQREQQRRVLDIVQGRCDRSTEDVEKQRRTAITRTNDRRRAEGLQVRLRLQSSLSSPVST